MSDQTPNKVSTTPTPPIEQPPKAVPQNTTLFRILNPELFMQPRRGFYMVGNAALVGCIGYLGYQYWIYNVEEQR
eukprot:CAMPEP_0168564844 /NCGR_PEP_ID=MMETSP0413-20121227/13478_1 /TAXON_ID=136452 /ORGANISM="Filamoeba nolandi, Strain NC-AS-23-1" /LENGTH=74 /DNA_ID=CAMNT_0008596575 /DNA_START=19 /DNA_END=240 /DNA_ORIENTATION=-